MPNRLKDFGKLFEPHTPRAAIGQRKLMSSLFDECFPHVGCMMNDW
jgi:hypothetical protein